MTPRSQGATQIVLARTDGPFSLEDGPVHVPLRAMPARAGAKARSLAALLERVQPDEHVLLVLRGLHAAQPPNIVVQIYLGLAEGETPTTQDDPHYAGTLNFFNVVRPPGAEGVHGPGSVRQLRCHRRDPEPAHVEEADRSRPPHAAARRPRRRGLETLDRAHRSGAAVDGTPGAVYRSPPDASS